MNKINHFRISSILDSEIVSGVKFGHGQIAALADGQRYFDCLRIDEPPSILHADEVGDRERIIRVFLSVRNQRKDSGSPDLYVADPDRNHLFLTKCRAAAIKVSDYTINKTLLNARKNNYLPGLESKRTSIDYEDFAFASEFAATDLCYKMGSTIEDILCDPGLASRFDSIAARIAPGRTAFEYRWAVLSIRKAAGRREKLTKEFAVPKLKGNFNLAKDELSTLPVASGVYLLEENNKALYARSTTNLREGIALHSNPALLEAVTERLWVPDPKSLVVNFAVVRDRKLLRLAEQKILNEKQPIFNVLRTGD